MQCGLKASRLFPSWPELDQQMFTWPWGEAAIIIIIRIEYPASTVGWDLGTYKI